MQVYALTTDAKEAEVNWFHEHLQELLELTSKKKITKQNRKDILFIIIGIGLKK